MVTLNFDDRLKNMKKKITFFFWSSRTLSLKGKIAIIKSHVLLRSIFSFNLVYVPNDILGQISNHFLPFSG